MKKRIFAIITQAIILALSITTFILVEINISTINEVLKESSAEGIAIIALLPLLIIGIIALLFESFLSFIVFFTTRHELALFNKLAVALDFILFIVAIASAVIAIAFR